MRLTLRTMLAYMDEILEAEDQQEIGKKIAQSEFASDLIRRTRDVMQKLRLGAPTLSGRGMGLDPNVVAEYLDNSLPAERVPEFERACLDSDMCLAEVGACHQILTLVLGHPAEVDIDSRQRMYNTLAVAHNAERVGGGPEAVTPAGEATASEGSVPAAEPVVVVSGGLRKKVRPKPEIPDYLREASGSRLWRYAAAAVVVTALLAGVALIVVGPTELLDGLVDTGKRVAITVPSPGPAPGDVVSPLSEAGAGVGSAGAPSSAPMAGPVGGDRNGAALGPGVPTPVPPEPDSLAAGPAGAEPGTGEATADPAPDSGVGRPPAVGNATEAVDRRAPVQIEGQSDSPDNGGTAPDEPSVRSQAPVGAAAGAPDSGQPKESPPPAPSAPTPSNAAPALDTEQPPNNGSAAVEVPEAAQATPAAELGILSNMQVLLKLDKQTGEWLRLPVRAPIAADERLLALPTFRPQVTLTSGSGITLEVVGAAAVEIQAADQEGVPGVNLLYGRIILLNVGRADNRFRIQLGDHQHQVEFRDVGATLAVGLSRTYIPGADPEKTPAPVVVRVHATSGRLQWRGANEDATTEMIAPGQWTLDKGRLLRVADPGTPPAWIDSGALHGIELRAARSLDAELVRDRPVKLVLQELVGGERSGRRSEVRSLAARCSVHVGEFEPFVEALNDPEQRTWRPLLIESLEEALVLGPEVATAIRQAFQRRRGEEAGNELFRLLWGYSSQDLEAGADKQLVAYLEHDQLDFRLLAHWNLMRVTGLGQSNRPNQLQDPRTPRQQIVRRWKERLDQRQIVPKTD